VTIGNVLRLEDTFCERANDITASNKLSGSSKIRDSLSPQPGYKVRRVSSTIFQGADFVHIGGADSEYRHLATCSADHSIKLWSTSNYEYTLERTLTGHQRWVWDAAFSADSAYLVTGKSIYFQAGPRLNGQKHHPIMRRGCGISHLGRRCGSTMGTTGIYIQPYLIALICCRAAVCCALNDINLA